MSMRADDIRNRREPTPTAFADWVFWKMNPSYHPSQKKPSSARSQWSGKYEHRQIERLRLWMRRGEDTNDMVSASDGWELSYADPNDDEQAKRVFRASRCTSSNCSRRSSIVTTALHPRSQSLLQMRNMRDT